MSRLKVVIEQIENARKGENRPWIYDKYGQVNNDVLTCDVLPLLNNLFEYEIEMSNSEIQKYLESDYYSAENTYNWNANISNDLDWKIYKRSGMSNIAIIIVHLYGDIRGGYSDYFVISLGDYESFIEFCSYELFDYTVGYKQLNDKYIADFDMFSESIEVFDNDGNEIGTFYEIETKELLKEIEVVEKLEKEI